MLLLLCLSFNKDKQHPFYWAMLYFIHWKLVFTVGEGNNYFRQNNWIRLKIFILCQAKFAFQVPEENQCGSLRSCIKYRIMNFLKNCILLCFLPCLNYFLQFYLPLTLETWSVHPDCSPKQKQFGTNSLCFHLLTSLIFLVCLTLLKTILPLLPWHCIWALLLLFKMIPNPCILCNICQSLF